MNALQVGKVGNELKVYFTWINKPSECLENQKLEVRNEDLKCLGTVTSEGKEFTEEELRKKVKELLRGS